MNVIPKVNGTVIERTDRFVMPAAWRTENGFETVDTVFAGRLQKIGNFNRGKNGKSAVTFAADNSMEEEAYCLDIQPEQVRIRARDERGCRWAFTTLYQLLAEGNGSAACGQIEDAPRFRYRGTMLDVCRHFYGKDEVKKIIEQISLLKMNVFHWHLSEDQGFRIESRRFPRLNEIGSWRRLSPQDPMVESGAYEPLARYGGYYTQDEIREIVDYAAARGVEIIPEIDLPGHASAILAAFPEYTCSGEPLKVKNTFGVHERIFCAGKEETYTFLCELLDEVMELFPSRYIHLGGDEAPKTVWHDCPLCNRLMKNQRLENYEQLQAYFTARLIEHVKAKGKIPIVWNESAASGTLDESALVQYWTEMAPGESYMIPEIQKGRRMILSDGDRLYISSGYAEMPLKSTLCYEPNVKGTPVPEENVQGVEAPVWTEWLSSEAELEELIHPRYLAVAELGWTRDRDYADFCERAQCFLTCRPLNILAAMPWEAATVHGDEAIRQIVRSLLMTGSRYRGMTTGEEGERSGRAEAITPDGSAQVDSTTMIRLFITNKMQAAYTQEEIEKAIGMVMQILSDRMG